MDPALLAYTEPLSVAPGAEIRLMVSATAGYEAAVLRLRHGSADPRGPGVREEVVSPLGFRDGRVQPWSPGSYLTVPAHEELDVDELTVTAWIMPTLLGRPQAIVARRAGRRGWSVGLSGDGRLAAWAGPDDEPVAITDRPLPTNRWTFISATLGRSGITLTQVPVPEWPIGSWRSSARHTAPVDLDATGIELRIAARQDGQHFNGTIDRPAIHAGLDLLAGWRPGRNPYGTTVADDGPFGLHATAINTPARGVPGCNWSGREVDFRLAPDEYDAIHFHEDDLTDAGWDPDVIWTIPDDLPSGVYAFRLIAGEEELRVPFYVRPRPGATTSPVAVLIPTFTYLAYANSHGGFGKYPTFEPTPRHRWAAEHKACSLYDTHTDGSGCYYASRRRPLTTITPDYSGPFGLWNLSADLCLIDWLAHEGVAHDVLTDDDLHAAGVDALAGYDVVLTGTHPEYYTAPMLDAHEAYLAAGGRLMYLGGNGYYWVTGVAPDEPHVIEIRRGHTGTRGWEVPPGETHLSSTGEPGGLWRHRGRAPQRHVGVGFTAQGGRGQGRPYEPNPVSRGGFALAGVAGPIEVDGLVSHAAAGMEIDRADPALGTPPHTVVLATAREFSDAFQLAIEDVLTANSRQGGTVEPRVRADLVFFEGPKDGAVLAVGSMAWCTSLGIDGYDNPVSRITGNVLRRFLDPAPFRSDE